MSCTVKFVAIAKMGPPFGRFDLDKIAVKVPVIALKPRQIIHNCVAASLEGRTHKVIRSGPRRVDAYDIRQDPGEERPLVFPVEHARHLDEHLRALRQRASQFPEPEPLASPGRGVEQELRALGYLE